MSSMARIGSKGGQAMSEDKMSEDNLPPEREWAIRRRLVIPQDTQFYRATLAGEFVTGDQPPDA